MVGMENHFRKIFCVSYFGNSLQLPGPWVPVSLVEFNNLSALSFTIIFVLISFKGQVCPLQSPFC